MWRSAATSKNFENNDTTWNSLVFLHVEWSALTVSQHLGFFRFELATNHMEQLLFSLFFGAIFKKKKLSLQTVPGGRTACSPPGEGALLFIILFTIIFHVAHLHM